MAFIEFPSVIVQRACEEKLDKFFNDRQQIENIMAMHISNFHLFGKHLQRMGKDEQKVRDLNGLCQMSDRVFMTIEDFKLLEDYI